MVGGERGEEEEVGDRDSDPQQLAWPIAWEGGRQGAPWAIPSGAWGRQGLASWVHPSGPQGTRMRRLPIVEGLQERRPQLTPV